MRTAATSIRWRCPLVSTGVWRSKYAQGQRLTVGCERGLRGEPAVVFGACVIERTPVMDTPVSAAHDGANTRKESPMPAEIHDVPPADRRVARDAEGGMLAAAWRAPSSRPRFVASLTRLRHSASFTAISFARLSGARNWRRGAFELALGAAVRSGLLGWAPRARGFYRDATRTPGGD